MKKLALLVLFFIQIQNCQADELVSRRFENTIKWGVGDINLMRRATGDKTITASDLEAFRLNNKGRLVFAVDVNESSNGSENRSSQGVAIAKAWISIRKNDTVYKFSNFSTPTQSAVATLGSIQRQFYYTLIGEAGSSRITSNPQSEIYGSSFDGVMNIPVDIDLSQASAAWLHVEFVKTNTLLGDPEAFYDFTGGFEDVAILTKSDADYLKALKPGQAQAPLVVTEQETCAICSHVYFPTSTDYYLAAYEDQYPKAGDYDFNDLLVAYRIDYGLDNNGLVKIINGEGYLLTRGGAYQLDWYLHIPLPLNTTGKGELSVYAPYNNTPMPGYPVGFQVNNSFNLRVFNNLKSLFASGNTVQVNTIWNSPYVPGQKFTFKVALDNSIPIKSIGPAPFDPYVFIRSTGYEIHLPGKQPLLNNSWNLRSGKTTFMDNNNFPFAIIFPTDWKWPNEYVNVTKAYPKFVDFVNSGGKTNLDWFKTQIASGLTRYSNNWKW